MQPTDRATLLQARRVDALRDVSAAALALAAHIEAGGEVPAGHHLNDTPYWQATLRAGEQLTDAPGEIAPCDCVIPDGWDEGDLLPPNPACTICQGSGDIEYWTPPIGTPTLLSPAPSPSPRSGPEELTMIQEVTIYRTDDGSEFRTRDAASAYQGRAYRVAAIMTALPDRPRGHGRYIQHTRDTVEPVAVALLELIEERTGEHTWITQTRQKGLVDAHPSFVGRLIGDYDDKALNAAWMRMQCIDWHTLREYDQPYFAAHPNEASGPEERA